MPGFNINGTGGPDNRASNVIETRRKHRWLFQTLDPVKDILVVLQSASRPNFTFEEPEMHHNEEVVRFAGKRSWEPLTLTWYDTAGNRDVTKKLYDWVDVTTGSIKDANTFRPGDEGPGSGSYKKEGKLQMLDGQGEAIETWILSGCWPQTINWGDLDYTSTDIQTVECTMRYDRAQIE